MDHFYFHLFCILIFPVPLQSLPTTQYINPQSSGFDVVGAPFTSSSSPPLDKSSPNPESFETGFCLLIDVEGMMFLTCWFVWSPISTSFLSYKSMYTSPTFSLSSMGPGNGFTHSVYVGRYLTLVYSGFLRPPLAVNSSWIWPQNPLHRVFPQAKLFLFDHPLTLKPSFFLPVFFFL